MTDATLPDIKQLKNKKSLKNNYFFTVLPPQVFEEDLHCILVGFWQLLDQVFDHVHSLFVVRRFCKQRQRCFYSTREYGATVWQPVV